MTTLVLWLGCLAVGGLGLILRYDRPKSPQPPHPAVQARFIELKLSSPPKKPNVQPAAPNSLRPPPMAQIPVTPLSAPALTPVAPPSSIVAFPVPADIPIGETSPGAVPSTPAPSAPSAGSEGSTTAPASPEVTVLRMGEGEGDQVKPEYPRQAARERQEGKVTVRFSVADNGRVLSAEVKNRSPWPLLDQAALEVVRNRWRFPAGNARLYEIIIEFKLNR